MKSRERYYRKFGNNDTGTYQHKVLTLPAPRQVGHPFDLAFSGWPRPSGILENRKHGDFNTKFGQIQNNASKATK